MSSSRQMSLEEFLDLDLANDGKGSQPAARTLAAMYGAECRAWLADTDSHGLESESYYYARRAAHVALLAFPGLRGE
jgi:hypothetical protein